MNTYDVTDFESFIQFVTWLASDRADEVAKERVASSSPRGPDAEGWENGTIEDFLEAATAWAVDVRNKSGQDPEPTWRELARFLHAGKIYE